MICELTTGEFQFSTTLVHASDKLDGKKSEDVCLVDSGIDYRILNCGFGDLKERLSFKIYTQKL